MEQSQSLNMNLSQQLVMTLELQQAIQILQLGAEDLRAEIEKEYLENPALEMDYTLDRAENKNSEFAAKDVAALADYLGDNRGNSEPSYFTDDIDREINFAAPVSLTLEEELLEQVDFTFSDGKNRAIATFIVGCIDDKGYLTMDVLEIASAMQKSAGEVLAVLQKVQEFEPTGVGARNLAECLRLQAKKQGIYNGLVAAVIDKHLDRLASSKLREIADIESVRPSDVQLAADIVKRLDPKPGSSYGTGDAAYITPDVIVEKIDGKYIVTLNDNYVPKLHISSIYQQNENFDSKTKKYIHQRLSAAAWLINSIEQRRTTIKAVVEEIVRRQVDFLEQGRLRPMTMRDVANAIGVHESTVSRAVANKYAELPQGIMALRKFFTANLAKNNSGEEFVAQEAKAAIAEFIKNENPQKPLSDQKLAELLKNKKMDISRRTVMKYREALGYPSSVKRKRY